MMRCLLLLALVVCASAEWKSIYKFPYTGWSLPISTAVQCPNSTTCFLTGGTHTSLPQVYYTTDGFKTVTMAEDDGKTLLLIDLAFSSDGVHAVAGGVGALKLPGLQYSTNGGMKWQNTEDIALLEAQRVYANGGSDFAFTGEINALFNDEGIGETSNGGRSWKHHEWSSATKASVPGGCAPAAGQFFSGAWYIICGSEPQEQSSSEPEEEQDDVKVIPLKNRRYELVYDAKTGHSKVQRRVRDHLEGNYTGAILYSTDSGSSYTVQYQEAGKYDIFDICCASATSCIATAGGTSAFGATNPGGYIMTLENGKWNVTASYPEPSFIYRCRYNAETKTYWVASGTAKSSLDSEVYTLTSTDGKTWTQTGGSVKGFIEILDFAFVAGSGGKEAYALAGAIDNVIAPLKYTSA